jgi:DNA-binding winged helix-turn-helix (wHTH) protein
MRVAFSDCLFDSDTRELFRGAKPIHVSPKAFRLLELLLENRPRALSKQELQEKLWPKTFVSEANLASLVAEVRGAIGEAGRGAKSVRTVYGYGYAFSGDVREEQPAAGRKRKRRAFLLWDKQEIPLAPGENILGRDVEADAQIDDTTVSRRHARVSISGGEAAIEDLGSKNGTFVDGKRVGKKPLQLTNGNEIQLGSVFLTFRLVSPDVSTESIHATRRR